MSQNQKVAVLHRWPVSFKEKVDHVARERGMSVNAYVYDRIRDVVERDLRKLAADTEEAVSR